MAGVGHTADSPSLGAISQLSHELFRGKPWGSFAVLKTFQLLADIFICVINQRFKLYTFQT